MEESKFLEKILSALSKIRGEISEKGGEFDFRYSLSKHLIEDALGWSRKSGEGHFLVEKEKKDIILYDDSSPPFPVIVFETKKPGEALEIKHYEQLAGYLEAIGCAKYGILTNGHILIFYEYIPGRTQKKFELNLDEVISKSALELEEEAKKKLLLLQQLARERFVKRGDAEYFREHYKETPLKYIRGIEDIGYSLFITSLKTSLEELTSTLAKFFDSFIVREDYSGEFLRKSFKEWEGWREFSGCKGEAKDIFCRETAYILLNRILFARICEDKTITDQRISGYRIANFLREHIEEKNPYLEALEDAYKGVERHYPHFYQLGIFDWWRIEKDKRALLSEDDLRKQEELEGELNFCLGAVLKRLNRFDFKEVNRDILGHVYEDYLSKEERKRLGEFYTPIEVVKYILDQVGFASDEKIEGKKLLDPACGSGTFLVEAMNRLIERYLKKYRKIKANDLPPDESKQVLESIIGAIYGFDINPFACHIAEINMLFHTIDLYDNVKQKFKDYALRRFNIYNTDSLKLPGEKAKTTLEEFTRINGRAKAYANDITKIDEIKRMQFDFVVGNPPYVRVQKLSKEMNEALRKNYQTVLGKFDLYIPFIERGVGLLSEKSFLGYINPNLFFNRDYGKNLRKFISEKCKIKQIIDFGDSGVFEDATNYPCILILQKEKHDKNIFKAVSIRSPKEDILSEIKRKIGFPYYSDEFYMIFEMEQDALTDEIWKLAPPHILKVLKKADSSRSDILGVISETIYEGFISGANPIYFVENLEMNLEKELLKKVPKGRDVKKWRINWKNRYVIYPHDENGNPYSEAKVSKEFPKIYEYLRGHISKLKERKYYGETPEEMFGVWFALVHPKPSTLFEQAKIVTPNLSTKNDFTFDEEGYYLDHDCYGIILKNKDRANYLLILGLLNSKLLEFYLKQISPFASGKWYRYMTGYLEQLPIRLPQSSSEKSPANVIVERVDRILSLMRRAGELEAKVAGFPEVGSGDASLFNLMKEQNLNKDSYNLNALSIEKTWTLKGKDFYKLHLTKNDYIAFDSIDLAEYLQKLLSKRERITKAELLSMKLPNKEEIERQMRGHGTDLEKAEKIKNEVSELENEIDEIVYRLYGLEDDDIAVIKEYLETY